MKHSGHKLSWDVLPFSWLGFFSFLFFSSLPSLLPFLPSFLSYLVTWYHSQTPTPQEALLGLWPWDTYAGNELETNGLPLTSHGPASPRFAPWERTSIFSGGILAIKQKNATVPSHTLISGDFQTLSTHHCKRRAFDINFTRHLGVERPWLSFLGRCFKFKSCGLVLCIVGLEDRGSRAFREETAY